MERIKVVKKVDTTESMYLDFSRKVSRCNGSSIIFFSYDFLQVLFQAASYDELDFDSSDIHYEDEEKNVESKIVLKNGMQLKFERVRINAFIYVLKSLEFSWKDYKYEYSCPEKLLETTHMYELVN